VKPQPKGYRRKTNQNGVMGSKANTAVARVGKGIGAYHWGHLFADSLAGALEDVNVADNLVAITDDANYAMKSIEHAMKTLAIVCIKGLGEPVWLEAIGYTELGTDIGVGMDYNIWIGSPDGLPTIALTFDFGDPEWMRVITSLLKYGE
jgi:hypothetical protein